MNGITPSSGDQSTGERNAQEEGDLASLICPPPSTWCPTCNGTEVDCLTCDGTGYIEPKEADRG